MKKNWYVNGNPWILEQNSYDSKNALYYETVFAQSNGHFGIRGYHEEAESKAIDSRREGLCAGIFFHTSGDDDDRPKNRVPSFENVVIPEIFGSTITLDGEMFTLEKGKILEYTRSFDMRSGLLTRTVTWKSPKGRTSLLKFERFVSVDQYQLAVQRITVAPQNWAGAVLVEFKCDGERQSKHDHWDPKLIRMLDPQKVIQNKSSETGSVVVLNTTGTNHAIAIAATLSQTCVPVADDKKWFCQRVEKTLSKNKMFTVVRTLAVVTSRDPQGGSNPRAYATTLAEKASSVGFNQLLKNTKKIWAERWKTADIVISGSDHDQKVARFNVFHLLQMAPFHTDQVSIGARGLSISRYNGVYFWDTEAFLLPFYSCVVPDVAKKLLTFRHHTLPGARKKAVRAGFVGAAYPWTTDSVLGEEQTGGEHEKVLWHQTAAIGYAIDQYVSVSGDRQFLCAEGIDMLVETARFWSSKAQLEKDGFYHIDHCIGPDETNADGKDNGYTNLLAQHHLKVAFVRVNHIQKKEPAQWRKIQKRLTITDKDLVLWNTVAQKLIIPLVPKTDIPLQDEFLFGKKDADMKKLRLREEMSQWKLTWQERRAYKLIKQADIVLSMFMLRDNFTLKQLKTAYDVYEPITQHVSSLSYNTYAMVATLIGKARQAYEYYQFAACLDIDNRKLAAHDGLHAAALGGTWQAITMGFGGMKIKDDKLTFDPHLPKQWKSLAFTIIHHGKTEKVVISANGKVVVGAVKAK